MNAKPIESTPMTRYLAAHRFGLGEAAIDSVAAPPSEWLIGQIGPAEKALGKGLLNTTQGLELIRNEDSAVRDSDKLTRGSAESAAAAERVLGFQKPRDEAMVADKRSRLLTAARSTRPFNERLVMFWANHFTVSSARGVVRGLTGAFERDVIRPHVSGNFADMLFAATTHPGMVRYLDNIYSAGPNSPVVVAAAPLRVVDRERPRGLNENLAREVLELHTLGVGGANKKDHGRSPYTQRDVTSFAKVLTGWRGGAYEQEPELEKSWHEPGPKKIMGRTYPEGAEGLKSALADLAHHPKTARNIAIKLSRHFVSDNPSPALVARLERAYMQSRGNLSVVYRALVESPEAWDPVAFKRKTPEELVISATRMLEMTGQDDDALSKSLVSEATDLGQSTQAASSPQGWLDKEEEWLSTDAMWKRMEWASRLGVLFGDSVDANAVAARSLGPQLGHPTRTSIQQASDARQALALLLMSPEFQRR